MTRSGLSRRSFLHFSAAASTAAAFHMATEPMLAAAARVKHFRGPLPKDAVLINQNENPLGPCQSARDAMAAMIPGSGRYSDYLVDNLLETFAQIEGLSPESIRVFAGSTPALHYAVRAFTSPQKSYVTADPGYEAGMMAAAESGVRVVKVPLTKTYAHDVQAMIAAAPDAGLFYICTPNNPTGTLTSHADVEYLLEHKPKNSVVVVDEAYIHFCEAPSVLDLVKAGKDLIVLRTFSKVYGMAGIRCGFAVARPELLDKINGYGGWNFMPVAAMVAASASLKDAQLVPERRRINAGNRQLTFDWLDRNGYSYIPSEANFFLLDTKRPGKETIDAMAKENVFIGRVWPVLPTHVRITVGTQAEMERFQQAFQNVMKGVVAFSVPPVPGARRERPMLVS